MGGVNELGIDDPRGEEKEGSARLAWGGGSGGGSDEEVGIYVYDQLVMKSSLKESSAGWAVSQLNWMMHILNPNQVGNLLGLLL